MGTGILRGCIGVVYTTPPSVINSATEFSQSWGSLPCMSGYTFTDNTAGILGVNKNSTDPQSITFAQTITNPMIFLNYVGMYF